jgi:hypothetical protein
MSGSRSPNAKGNSRKPFEVKKNIIESIIWNSKIS